MKHSEGERTRGGDMVVVGSKGVCHREGGLGVFEGGGGGMVH